jgi:hypothetical protein
MWTLKVSYFSYLGVKFTYFEKVKLHTVCNLTDIKEERKKEKKERKERKKS